MATLPYPTLPDLYPTLPDPTRPYPALLATNYRGDGIVQAVEEHGVCPRQLHWAPKVVSNKCVRVQQVCSCPTIVFVSNKCVCVQQVCSCSTSVFVFNKCVQQVCSTSVFVFNKSVQQV